ncbi:alpha/beta fold hydrolase [Sinimarinibacterium thermocellulolyticum]|uniref:Alpha/beta hydrolase n=1 Tax=Sinimarinibacterium thermocellulolyticum TaxID=3170016 RepID=A0ABV2AC92_9GAMM
MSFSRWRDTGAHFHFNGHDIFYQRHGAGETALLLIHGFPTASWDFEPVWNGLCERFEHVLAPDLLGFGFSAKPKRHRYSLLEQADLCEQLLARYEVRRVHVLAHDYGVSVAQELLARQLERPEREATILSTVLLNGGLFPETHRPTGAQKLLKSPLGPLLAALMNERAFGRAFSRVFGPRTRPTPIELHDFWRLITFNDGQRVIPRLLRYIDERRAQRSRWVGALTHTTVPLRLINGAEDPVSGAHMARRYAELVPDADIVSLEGIGHYPQFEAPDRVLRAVLDFHRRRVTSAPSGA